MTVEQIDRFLASPCDLLGDGVTWRGWFGNVLWELIRDSGNFSGKRPGCNSDWENDLVTAISQFEPSMVDEWETDDDGVAIPLYWNQPRFYAVCQQVINRLIPGLNLADFDSEGER